MVAEALSLEHVCKGFSRGGQRTNVLTGVSLQVEPGEVVAIVGGRLKGKTTLLKIAAGIERPDQGSVSLGSRNLAEHGNRLWWTRLLGRKIAWSGRDGPEREILWIDRGGPDLDMEVSKFVGWPLALHGCGRGHAERMAAEALERVGAGKCMGRRWRDLSDWERMLVGLARAFAGNPRIVIIDDLLDALVDPDSKVVCGLLRSLLEESEPRCGVLISVSDIESATETEADRVFSLTREGTLKAMSGQARKDADVIPLHNHAKGEGSRDVGA
jgi:predicted ABC-type transport system involved in lysophospholipase L1 biosynthesis ATPase subunit